MLPGTAGVSEVNPPTRGRFTAMEKGYLSAPRWPVRARARRARLGPSRMGKQADRVTRRWENLVWEMCVFACVCLLSHKNRNAVIGATTKMALIRILGYVYCKIITFHLIIMNCGHG